LTGLAVLSNKSMANIARCVLDSADKTNLSRFLSEADWSDEKVNDRRVEYLLAQTERVRKHSKESWFVLDDTLCEYVGSLFEYVACHYNHGNAHQLLEQDVKVQVVFETLFAKQGLSVPAGSG
jgi:hypothetical protein